MKLSVSYLSVDRDLSEALFELDRTKCDYIHVDVMDGKFVSGKTDKFENLYPVLSLSSKPKDVHLMVDDVKDYVLKYSRLNPEFITFHLESGCNTLDLINYIKSLNIRVGLSLKPDTPVESIKPYLDLIDLVLVMSVEPGKGGQAFIDSSIDKINVLNELRDMYNYNYLIEVDGGINDNTYQLCHNADIIVIGSYITKSRDYKAQIDKILR